MKTFFLLLSLLIVTNLSMAQQQKQDHKPLKIGVARLTHDHVHGLFNRPEKGTLEVVGIYEPDQALAQRYARQYGFSMDIVFDNMETMLQQTQPEAVTAFGSIEEHLGVVETCAPLGIHVMVEKPLAISVAHARKMKTLAEKHNIHLLTNYETTWYATNHQAYEMVVKDDAVGKLRKVVVHDGHEGPKEIGVSQEFLHWLTDPKANGGGAIIDFGCYGANLITWLMKGERPTAVTGITQQFKPDVYPKVDDEATILLQYPGTQGIIQASWNWPFGRKDMEIYGQTGYIMADNSTDMRIRLAGDEQARQETLPKRKAPYDDPFSFLVAVVRDQIKVASYDLSSLENNMIVVEILEAARKSAETGKTIYLK